MNKLLVGVLALTLIGSMGAADTLINQLDNSSFEDWSDGAPEDWRVISEPVEQETNAHDGDLAAKLLLPGDVEQAGIAQLVALDEDDAPIVPNATYELSFAADLSGGNKADPAQESPNATAVIEWRNAFGETTDRDTVDIELSDGYVDYTDTFEAPLDATEADIQFLLDKGDTVATDVNLRIDAVDFGPADPLS